MEQTLETGIYASVLMILAIILIAAAVLFTAAEWRILTKAGEKGWKSLVPVYSVFISHHIVGMSHVWFILEVVIWVIEIVFELVKLPEAVVLGFGIAAGIFTIVSEWIHVIRLCNCFGKGLGFKIGMLLFPNLFLLIIAYGKAEYQKPNH